MKRMPGKARGTSVIAVAIVASVFLASSIALARRGGLGNQYQGHVEATPDAQIGFDVQKTKHGRRISHLQAHLFYACQEGGSAEAFGQTKGTLRVDKNGRFAGTLKVKKFLVRGTFSDGTYAVRGKLLRHGKAQGTIDANLHVPDVRCYTGGLDWKAKRGATVDREHGR